VVPSLNTNCGWLSEMVPANTYAGDGAMKFHTGYGTRYGTGYGNGQNVPYRRNAAGRAANRTTTTLPRGRANGPCPARACGKAAPLETSSPKSAKQIVRRMTLSRRCLAALN